MNVMKSAMNRHSTNFETLNMTSRTNEVLCAVRHMVLVCSGNARIAIANTPTCVTQRCMTTLGSVWFSRFVTFHMCFVPCATLAMPTESMTDEQPQTRHTMVHPLAAYPHTFNELWLSNSNMMAYNIMMSKNAKTLATIACELRSVPNKIALTITPVNMFTGASFIHTCILFTHSKSAFLICDSFEDMDTKWTHGSFEARRVDEKDVLLRMPPVEQLTRLQEIVAAHEVWDRTVKADAAGVEFAKTPDAWAVTHWGLRGGVRVHFHDPYPSERVVLGHPRAVHGLKVGDVVAYSLQFVRCLTHDCLYVGKGYVVTYTRTKDCDVGEVRLVDLNEHTMNGRMWTVLQTDRTHTQRMTAVSRALASVGRFLKYDTRHFNCQHVCTAWMYDKPASRGAITIRNLVLGLSGFTTASLGVVFVGNRLAHETV